MKHQSIRYRAVAALLSLLVCLSMAVSCTGSKNNPEQTSEESNPPEQENNIKLAWDGAATGRIVFPMLSTACASGAVTKLQNAIKAACGVSLRATSDTLAGEIGGESVILLGDTSFPASAAAKAKLTENSFSVVVENGTVVVVASNDALYSLAVDHLLSVCTVGDGVLTLPLTYTYTSESYPAVPIITESDRDFRIVYDLDSQESKDAANSIRDAIRNRFGFTPAVVADTQTRTGREILVGDTNRSFSKANPSYYMDYTINVDEQNRTVALTGSLADATKEFCNFIASSTTDTFSLFPALMGAKPAAGYGSIPAYRDTIYNLMNQSDLNSYYVLYQNSNTTEYGAYLQKLESLGYKQYAYREVNKNLFATYTDGYNILSINYIDYYKITRIASETTDHATLGKQNSDAEQIVTTPQLTQVNGQCAFIIRLSDGRFIVIDGGHNREEYYKPIYEQLCAQNTLQGKPVIAAWFLSHAHVDHYGAFIGFAEHYASNVKLEHVVLNIPSYATYSKNLEAADVTPTMKALIASLKQTISTRYSNTNIIIPHAGQIMWFGDAMIDMLYTHEDLSPTPMTVTNSSCLIYTVSIAGQRIVILNDAYDDSCSIVYRMYGNTLKSDMVQVAHHGYNGGNAAMYLKIDADTALWTNPYQIIMESSLWNSPRNYFDVNSVSENLMMDDHSVMILPLPHAVGSVPAYARTFS